MEWGGDGRKHPRPTVTPVTGVGLSTATATAARPHASYRHEALIYRGDGDFLAGTVPFVLDGLDAGQPVMVAIGARRLALLEDALGSRARQVLRVDMHELGRNPASIIPAWCEFVGDHAGAAVRGIGEPVWAGRRDVEVAECQLHEALLNVAVAPDTPLWLRCPYDADTLGADVVEAAHRSHPLLVEGEEFRGSTAYGGIHHAEAVFGTQLPEPAGPVETLPFAGAELPLVRETVTRRAAQAGIEAHRAADLVLAIHELATNSVRHGGGTGVLRVWEDALSLACEVSDAGHIDDPLAGRRHPPLSSEGGRGLWLANQLGDLVQLRSSPAGTAVRVLTWL